MKNVFEDLARRVMAAEVFRYLQLGRESRLEAGYGTLDVGLGVYMIGALGE